MRRKWFFIAPLAILALALFIFVGGEIVMLLWNWLMPHLFEWRPITFWQALGLLIFCRILFGGHGFLGSGRSNMRHKMRERMRERWEQMTPEEREKARQRFGGFCGPATTEPKV